MRELTLDPRDLDAQAQRVRSELSGLARCLVRMREPGQPITRAAWEDAMDAIGDYLPPDQRVSDWAANPPLVALNRYLKAAKRLIRDIEEILSVRS